MSPPPRVSIVIPAYNGGQLLMACLRSVFAQNGSEARVIIVDNASTDGSPAEAAAAFPQVRIIRNEHNRGFGVACNTGIQAALDEGADYIMLLNQDVVLPADTCARTVRVMQEDEKIGLVAPLQMTYTGEMLDPVFQCSMPPGVALEISEGRSQPLYHVPFVPFVVVLLRRRTLASIGGFDPLFWLYCEDNDYCAMLERGCWKITVTSLARVHHYGGQAHARRSLRWRCNWTYGRCVFFLKWRRQPLWPAVIRMMRLAWSMHGIRDPLPAVVAICRCLARIRQIISRRKGGEAFAFRFNARAQA